MKYRIRKTKEIVDVVGYSACTHTRCSTTDYVCYIDNGGNEVIGRGLNLIWDFEPINEESVNNFDLQSFRAEAAKDILCHLLDRYTGDSDNKGFVTQAIGIADELIKQLKENVMENKAFAWLEKQGEQKPTDESESKFKVGDWVVSEITGSVYQIKNCIENLSNHKYGYDLTNGGYISSGKVNHYHLWTINDAKDGDVLVFDDIIMLFKSIKTFCTANTYILYCDRIVVDDWCDFGDDAHPAAKEQRELLFQKMKEAGYEWNAEKKELKKIEQKPDEWEPQTGDTFRKKGTTFPVYYLCDKREDGTTFGFLQNSEAGIITIFALKNDYELVKRPKSIEDVVEEELNRALQTKVEQTSAWSEEDEKNITHIQSVLECWDREHSSSSISSVIPKCIDWIKSLKDRIQPQPKQE